MQASPVFNGFLIVCSIIVMTMLLSPKFRKSEHWQATLTPLSSIIGSGFLIMAPILASIVGNFSPLAVFGVVLLAYSIGHVIRFNILHVEPRSYAGTLSHRTK